MHFYVQKLSSVWLASCKHSVMIGKKRSFTIESSFYIIFEPVLPDHADRNDNTVIYQSNAIETSCQLTCFPYRAIVHLSSRWFDSGYAPMMMQYASLGCFYLQSLIIYFYYLYTYFLL